MLVSLEPLRRVAVKSAVAILFYFAIPGLAAANGGTTYTMPSTGESAIAACSGSIVPDPAAPEDAFVRFFVYSDQPGQVVRLQVTSADVDPSDSFRIGQYIQQVANAGDSWLARDSRSGTGAQPYGPDGGLLIIFHSKDAGPGDDSSTFEIEISCEEPAPRTIDRPEHVYPCASTLYDSGGPLGNYQDQENERVNYPFQNDVGYFVTVEAYDLEENFDYLRLFSKTGGVETLQTEFTGSGADFVTLLPQGHQMDIEFTSDVSNTSEGFSAEVQCVQTLYHLDPARKVAEGASSAELERGTLATLAPPFGFVVPMQESSLDEYLPNQESGDYYRGLLTGADLTAAINYSIGDGDSLLIQDGDYNLIESLGPGNGEAFVTDLNTGFSSGSLRFRFSSDGSEEGNFFVQFFDSILLDSARPISNFKTCGLVITDSGGLDGVYSNNENVSINVLPNNPASVLKLTVLVEGVEEFFDELRITDIASSQVLGSTETSLASTLYGSGGGVTIEFESDASATFSGFTIVAECSYDDPIFIDGFESGSTSAW